VQQLFSHSKWEAKCMFQSLHWDRTVRIVNELYSLGNTLHWHALAMPKLNICYFVMCLKATILFSAIRLQKEVPTFQQRGSKVKAMYQTNCSAEQVSDTWKKDVGLILGPHFFSFLSLLARAWQVYALCTLCRSRDQHRFWLKAPRPAVSRAAE